MNYVAHSHSGMQVWLGNFISARHAVELKRVRQMSGVHPRCLYLYTHQGRRGFKPLYRFEQQAFVSFLRIRDAWCPACCLVLVYLRHIGIAGASSALLVPINTYFGA